MPACPYRWPRVVLQPCDLGLDQTCKFSFFIGMTSMLLGMNVNCYTAWFILFILSVMLNALVAALSASWINHESVPGSGGEIVVSGYCACAGIPTMCKR